MINDQIFSKMTKEYSKELTEKIKMNNWGKLSELKLRQALTEEIRQEKNDVVVEVKYIEEILERDNYLELHKLVQNIFQEYIPFITMRRVIQKINKCGIELVFNKIDDHKSKGYSEAMCYIR